MAKRTARSIATLILTLACPLAWAQTTTVYRCVDAEGHVSLQDEPCAAGQQQSVREMAEPSALETTPAIEIDGVQRDPAEPTAPAPPPAPTPPPPPPPLWLCVDHEGETYESRDGVPRARWMPLWALGLDPRAPPTTFGKVGAPPPKPPPSTPRIPTTDELPAFREPLVWVEDRCRRLDDRSACERYADRLSEVRRQQFNAQPSGRRALEPEEKELAEILRRSCGR